MSTKSAAAQPEVEEKTGDGTSAHAPVDPKVTHLTEAERVGRGKAAREAGTAREPFDTRAVERSRPGRNRRCRYPRACSRARAHPLRPNAGIAVHVLPRCSEPHGARPCGNAENRPQGTALRRRPPLQFRGLRIAVPGSRLRSQRFRRDASRTVRVGRQAVGRKLRDRRQGSRLRRPRKAIRRLDRRPCISRGDARVRGDETTSVSGTRGWMSSDMAANLRAQKDKKQAKALERGVAKARTKDSMKAFNKLTHLVDGEPRIISDPPLIVPIAGARGGAGLDPDEITDGV